MRNIARAFVVCMVVLATVVPSGATDAEDPVLWIIDLVQGIVDLSKWVAEAADKSHDPKQMFSCTDVDLSMLLGDEDKPELERLLVDLAMDPGDQARHVRLGNYYARRSLWHHAATSFSCANGIDNKVARVWNNLGIVYLGLGNPSSAVTVLGKAVKLEPDYALAFYNLGMAYDAQEKYEAALKAYEKAITLDPKLATVKHNPAAASNRHQITLFLRRLENNPIVLATSLDE